MLNIEGRERVARMLQKFVIACFAIPSLALCSELQGKALIVKRGFMVALHFLKQRNDTPKWIKDANNGKSGNEKIDYNSSFEEIGNMLGEIVECKISGKEPILLYDRSIMLSQANWNYVFVKQCIYNYIKSGNYKYNEVEVKLMTDYGNKKEISRSNRDARAYLGDMKLSGVLEKIRNTIQSTSFNPRGATDDVFFGFSPFWIFPELYLRNSLPDNVKNWWQKEPHHFKQQKHGFPLHNNSKYFWFEAWLP